MTLRERNLVMDCLRCLEGFQATYGFGQDMIKNIAHAIEIMRHVEIKSPGLPVSAGGDPEEPRYCVECGEPVLESQLTCSKTACIENFRRGIGMTAPRP